MTLAIARERPQGRASAASERLDRRLSEQQGKALFGHDMSRKVKKFWSSSGFVAQGGEASSFIFEEIVFVRTRYPRFKSISRRPRAHGTGRQDVGSPA